jgi:tight adherence protein B
MDPLFLFFLIALFIAVVLLLEALYTGWNSRKGPEAKRLERRLRVMSAGGYSDTQQISILKERLLSDSPFLQRVLMGIPRMQGADRILEQSGLPWSVSKFLFFTLVFGVTGYLLATWRHMPWWIAVPTAVGFALLPLMYVRYKKGARLTQIDLQLPDALDLMGRALRAGHAFPSALKMAGDEMSDPLAAEFRIAFDEVNYGISMPDALKNLANRVPSVDLRYFVIAVLIQRETGGNLAEILSNISRIIRERVKLLGDIRVLSAEGKMSAWILTLLPFVTAFVINLLNPKFMSVLFTDPVGKKMVVVALISMLLGILWMRKIIKIRV